MNEVGCLVCWFGGVWRLLETCLLCVFGFVGVVCELDSVFVCFLCLFFVFECFWLGLLAERCVWLVFLGFNVFVFVRRV